MGGGEDEEDDAECLEHDEDDEEGYIVPYIGDASAVTCYLKRSNNENIGETGQLRSQVEERTAESEICIVIGQLSTFNRRAVSCTIHDACWSPRRSSVAAARPTSGLRRR